MGWCLGSGGPQFRKATFKMLRTFPERKVRRCDCFVNQRTEHNETASLCTYITSAFQWLTRRERSDPSSDVMHANARAAKRALCGSERAPADCLRRPMSHTDPACLVLRGPPRLGHSKEMIRGQLWAWSSGPLGSICETQTQWPRAGSNGLWDGKQIRSEHLRARHVWGMGDEKYRAHPGRSIQEPESCGLRRD